MRYRFSTLARIGRFDLAVLSTLCASALLLLGLWGQSRAAAGNDGALTPKKPGDSAETTYLLYKTVDLAGRARLHALPYRDGAFGQDLAPRPVSPAEESVWDFAPSPHGGQVVYAALGEMGFGDLRLVELSTGQERPLLACEKGSCSGPSWSSDGKLLAYTRRSVNAFASGLLSPPRIWVLDVASGETGPVFSDSQRLGLEARWSVDGKWLCFVSPEQQKLTSLNLATGQTVFLPTATGETCAWDTVQARLYTTDSWQIRGQWVTHLIAVDPSAVAQVDLSGADSLVHDSSPAVSPDGAWIVFQRKELEGSGATRGSQIWRMRPDGANAAALTADPAYDHGPPVWSPDGRYVVTRRFPLRGPAITPSLWLIDPQRGALRQLVEPGDFPAFAR